MKRAAVTTFAIFLIFAPAAALAHPGHEGAGGLVHGFFHPVTGIDHVLAMIAVGVLAAQYGGRALWLVPMSFLVAMATAGAIGMAGIPVQIVEAGIGLSVVVLGLMIAFQIKPPTLVAMVVVGFFALFHGYAHGSEMPDGPAGLSFAAGLSRCDRFAAERGRRTWAALATADFEPAFDSSRWWSNGAGWHCSVGECPLIKGR